MRDFALVAALAVLAPVASALSVVEPTGPTASNQAAQCQFESGVSFYRAVTTSPPASSSRLVTASLRFHLF